MIPKVKNTQQKIAEHYAYAIEHDLDDELTRSPAFQFYASDWLSSATTSMFDAEQRGWFIQLLARAWWDGRPQGTLPANSEDTLKELANYMRFNGFSTKRLTNVVQTFNVTLDEYELALDYPRRWSQVLGQFKPVPGAAALLHNPKMTQILMESLENRRVRLRASRVAIEERERLKSGNKGVNTKRITHRPTDRGTKRATNRPEIYHDTSTSSSSSPSNTSRSVSQSPNLPSEVSMENLDLLGYALPSETTNPEEFNTVKAGKERGTKFNPQKFLLTTTMVAWQQAKYPEFVDGDIAYLKEKFIAVFTGKVKQDWPRTWYNFVNNEVVLHGYRPGDYDWRSKASKPSKQESFNDQRIKSQQAIVAEEEARLEEFKETRTRDKNGDLFNQSPAPILSPNDE